MDAGVKHLNVHIYLITSVYQVLQSTCVVLNMKNKEVCHSEL